MRWQYLRVFSDRARVGKISIRFLMAYGALSLMFYDYDYCKVECVEFSWYLLAKRRENSINFPSSHFLFAYEERFSMTSVSFPSHQAQLWDEEFKLSQLEVSESLLHHCAMVLISSGKINFYRFYRLSGGERRWKCRLDDCELTKLLYWNFYWIWWCCHESLCRCFNYSNAHWTSIWQLWKRKSSW